MTFKSSLKIRLSLKELKLGDSILEVRKKFLTLD